MVKKIIIATNNKGKIKEIKEILNDYELYSLSDMNIDIDVIEDQDSFLLNALKKAKEIYDITNIPTIADDSGLCINELNDFPGVLTHRFLGEDATDLDRNNYLIKEADKTKNRDAYVMCNIVYYDGKDKIVGEGILKGKITKELRGHNGFGFDPIFEVNGKTLAEISSEEKNKISARRLALNNLKNKLK